MQEPGQVRLPLRVDILYGEPVGLAVERVAAVLVVERRVLHVAQAVHWREPPSAHDEMLVRAWLELPLQPVVRRVEDGAEGVVVLRIA
jgi:hypothetical protein